MCHCNPCFLFLYVRALDLCFSSWHSYLVNAVDTFNNLCLFSCLCTFPCAFIPVGQSLWPLLAATARRWSFLQQLLETLLCIVPPPLSLHLYFLFVFVAAFCWPTQYYCLATFQPWTAVSCFVSMKWKKWKLPFAPVFYFRLRAWQFYFFFMLEYCMADQNTVISLDDWWKGCV